MEIQLAILESIQEVRAQMRRCKTEAELRETGLRLVRLYSLLDPDTIIEYMNTQERRVA